MPKRKIVQPARRSGKRLAEGLRVAEEIDRMVAKGTTEPNVKKPEDRLHYTPKANSDMSDALAFALQGADHYGWVSGNKIGEKAWNELHTAAVKSLYREDLNLIAFAKARKWSTPYRQITEPMIRARMKTIYDARKAGRVKWHKNKLPPFVKAKVKADIRPGAVKVVWFDEASNIDEKVWAMAVGYSKTAMDEGSRVVLDREAVLHNKARSQLIQEVRSTQCGALDWKPSEKAIRERMTLIHWTENAPSWNDATVVALGNSAMAMGLDPEKVMGPVSYGAWRAIRTAAVRTLKTEAAAKANHTVPEPTKAEIARKMRDIVEHRKDNHDRYVRSLEQQVEKMCFPPGRMPDTTADTQAAPIAPTGTPAAPMDKEAEERIKRIYREANQLPYYMEPGDFLKAIVTALVVVVTIGAAVLWALQPEPGDEKRRALRYAQNCTERWPGHSTKLTTNYTCVVDLGVNDVQDWWPEDKIGGRAR